MFCPSCGLEDKQANQYCRSCGADLQPVRTALLRPDRITESATAARDEIGRAIAAKVRETRTAAELSTVVEEVLPEIEKFLESPEEKRLRRMRVGTILSSIGLGAAIGISIVSQFMGDRDVIFLAALGIVCFFLGLGFVINGVLLTVPGKSLPDAAAHTDREQEFDAEGFAPAELDPADAKSLFPSVTEHTTRSLEREK
ncbi:MAG TPA: zinc ribbon domain-containing protein [Pyrinomonadaceae bacterium]|nr:zinc ribbon domain-containing protein [Pyrinomonadaceae bacterium]